MREVSRVKPLEEKLIGNLEFEDNLQNSILLFNLYCDKSEIDAIQEFANEHSTVIRKYHETGNLEIDELDRKLRILTDLIRKNNRAQLKLQQV
jgi:hypothetical protein